MNNALFARDVPANKHRLPMHVVKCWRGVLFDVCKCVLKYSKSYVYTSFVVQNGTGWRRKGNKKEKEYEGGVVRIYTNQMRWNDAALLVGFCCPKNSLFNRKII